MTIQSIYDAWRSNSLPNLNTVKLTLDGNSVLNGDFTVASNTSELLKLTATNVNSFVGTGISTSDTTDDKGLNITGGNLELSISADNTYTYSLSGQGALNNVAGLTLSVDNAKASGTQAGTNVELTNFELGVGSVTRLSGDSLFYNSQNNQLSFATTNASANVGNGANTQDTSDDVGLAITNASFNISSDGQDYNYTITQGSASLNGLGNLSLSVGNVTAAGNTSSIALQLSNYSLGVDSLAQLSGATLDVSVQSNGSQISLNATNVSAFAGYSTDSLSRVDDIGLEINNANFDLQLKADKTYTYNLNNGAVAVRGIDGLILSANTVNATGNNTTNSFNLGFGNAEVGLANAVSFNAASLEFKVEKKGADNFISLIGEDLSTFIGDNKGTITINDDSGLLINNADFNLSINADNTYSYNLNNAEVSVRGIDGFTVEAGSVSASGNESSDFSLKLEDAKLGLGSLTYLSGAEIELSLKGTSANQTVSFTGKNLSAFAGYGAGNNQQNDDIGLAISNADLELLLNANNTYSYNLSSGLAESRGITGLEVSASSILAQGNQDNIKFSLNDSKLGLGNLIKLSGTEIEFTVENPYL